MKFSRDVDKGVRLPNGARSLCRYGGHLSSSLLGSPRYPATSCNHAAGKLKREAEVISSSVKLEMEKIKFMQLEAK